MTTTILAHFDGKQALVLDEPVDLPVGTPLRVHVEPIEKAAANITQRLPLTMNLESIRAFAIDPQQAWRPLDVEIDPVLGRTIAEDPEFNIEES